MCSAKSLVVVLITRSRICSWNQVLCRLLWPHSWITHTLTHTFALSGHKSRDRGCSREQLTDVLCRAAGLEELLLSNTDWPRFGSFQMGRSPVCGLMGELQPIPALQWMDLDRPPVHSRTTWRDQQPFALTFVPMCRVECGIMFLDCERKLLKPHAHTEGTRHPLAWNRTGDNSSLAFCWKIRVWKVLCWYNLLKIHKILKKQKNKG